MEEENKTSEPLSEDEMKKLVELMGTAPVSEEKQNKHSFLVKVVETDDTTKLGYLTEEELGMPKLPLRATKEIALFAGITGQPYLEDFFNKEAEITTSTSLSKDAKLLTLAALDKKEIADVTKKPKKNSGWFTKKKPEGEE